MHNQERFLRAMQEAGYGERVHHNAPMAEYTSFAVGGPADLLMEASTLDELVAWMTMARQAQVPAMVLGSGTNVLVSDLGIRGVVILNACRQYAISDDGLLRAESGCLFVELAREAVRRGWAGLEWAVGIPGTLGGAVVGNAGAYGGYIGDLLVRARLLGPDGSIRTVCKSELGYGYRTSMLKREPLTQPRTIVLDAELLLSRGDAALLAERARQVTDQRRAHTPSGCCAGSTFMRTDQYPAGFLIEQAGLKGYRLGGAQVSPHHANFIMNTGGATASEIAQLIALIQERVWQDFAQRLEPEVQFVGEWPARESAADTPGRKG
ncbi:MAG: UDP-N-acetylmuramate dehydrogenase [Anaerolineae bacterium]|nr:UDP-N-acetylmuramate dehydrogenase [Chloroflexota bacterium]